MKTIGIVTSTRAEYGLLKPLMKILAERNNIKIIATGTHVSPEFGMTINMIENDGIIVDEKVEILLSSDTKVGICKTMGLAMISFGELFDRCKLDALIVLGDRYEIFTIAAAATVSQIPLIHLYGGETTEGAFDEVFRHSITKMSHIHFTSTEEYKKRVIQLGEDPTRVFNVGAIGIENIRNIPLMSKNELEESINFKLDKPYVLVTFHPVTLEESSAEKQFNELLKALDHFKEIKIIFTKANSDTDGRIINKMIDRYVENKGNSIAFISMGQLRYLSAMKYCSAVIGNSSSGIVEAPSFYVPTVNIGDRQKGRIQAKSIINSFDKEENIIESIKKAFSIEFNNEIYQTKNPYGEGNVSEKIVKIIEDAIKSDKLNLKKRFYDLE